MQLTIFRYFPDCNINNFRQCIVEKAEEKLDFSMCEKLISDNFHNSVLDCQNTVKNSIVDEAIKQSDPELCEKISQYHGNLRIASNSADCKKVVDFNLITTEAESQSNPLLCEKLAYQDQESQPHSSVVDSCKREVENNIKSIEQKGKVGE